ncbi:GMC family oxidoreductase [Methylorubrum extorquens]|uniref:GMC family oxidoreductase n=1 Tax=Methylorubrum extorquens TaxID=408 RepID=UPI001EE5C02E|nr:GMC family oxidoreductase [Methylorubrum extorquens]MCG5248420.1 GMC family oxidoreductase [Methylorubrum extorquens]
MQETFDVVIVGSGAGGAPIANRLVRKGMSVLVIEKGPLLRPSYQVPGERSDFRRDEIYASSTEKVLRIPDLGNTGVSYYSSHVEPDLNDEPHVYKSEDGSDKATIEGYTAQVVGGGTQIYGGVSLRFTPTDLALATFNDRRRSKIVADPDEDVRREARDWPYDYATLEPYYALAEELLGINGTSRNQAKPFLSGDRYQVPLTPNPISAFAYEGMIELGKRVGGGIEPYRTPLAVITQDHAPSGRRVPRDASGQPDPEAAKTSYVNRYGDPLGLKSSTWVSLLSPVEKEPNFAIWPNCVVTRLSSDGARVTGVHLLDPGGTERVVRGKIVVVACSAIESVRLLKLSATLDANFDRRINDSGLLGNYFLTHCFGGARALMPGRFDKSKALDADWATDCCATQDFLEENGLWAGAAIYNNTSDQALPLSLFRTHGSEDLDTLWNGFMSDTGMRQDNFIKFLENEFGRGLSVSFMANQVPQRSNRIELHPRVKDKWGRPAAYILKDWHPHDRALMDVYAKQCGNVLRYGGDPVGRDYPIGGEGSIYKAGNALARMANHILGGARFGTDRADSVLDPDCRAWQFDNLYVTDGAFMPTSGGANPTLTIQANAFRVADTLLARA